MEVYHFNFTKLIYAGVYNARVLKSISNCLFPTHFVIAETKIGMQDKRINIGILTCTYTHNILADLVYTGESIPFYNILL